MNLKPYPKGLAVCLLVILFHTPANLKAQDAVSTHFFDSLMEKKFAINNWVVQQHQQQQQREWPEHPLNASTGQTAHPPKPTSNGSSHLYSGHHYAGHTMDVMLKLDENKSNLMGATGSIGATGTTGATGSLRGGSLEPIPGSQLDEQGPSGGSRVQPATQPNDNQKPVTSFQSTQPAAAESPELKDWRKKNADLINSLKPQERALAYTKKYKDYKSRCDACHGDPLEFEKVFYECLVEETKQVKG